MSDQIWWFVTRSSAIVAWSAAAISMLIGLMTSSRLLGRRPTIPWLTDIHRYLSSMSLIFVGIHMVSLWLDEFVDFGLSELLVPWEAEVPGLSPTGIALGVIATWILVLVHLTSLVKDRMPGRLWRSIHLSSFLVLILGSIHAVQTGSDMDNPIALAAGISLITAIAIATVVRAVRYRQLVHLLNEPVGGPPHTGSAMSPSGYDGPTRYAPPRYHDPDHLTPRR